MSTVSPAKMPAVHKQSKCHVTCQWMNLKGISLSAVCRFSHKEFEGKNANHLTRRWSRDPCNIPWSPDEINDSAVGCC